MDEPLVSIVTPVYNGESHLHECIESVLSQTYSNWEYVIVDNCSTDMTPEIIARFAATDDRIRVIRNPETVGALKNHNIAVSHISPTAQYCKLLHADDRLLPRCVEQMVRVAEQHPSIGMVGSYSQWRTKVVGRGLPAGESFFSGKDIGKRTLLQQVNPFWSPSCHLHRTAAIKEREYFYDEQNLHADVQSSYEIMCRWDFGFVHETLTYIRSHDDSRTSTLANPLKKNLATNLDLLVTYGPEFLTEDELSAQIARQLTQYYQNLAMSAFEWRGREFWKFHHQAMKEAGQPMSVSRLLRMIAMQFVSSPVKNSRRLLRWMLRRPMSRLQ